MGKNQIFATASMALLLMVVSSTKADILFKKRPPITLPTFPPFNLLPMGLIPTTPQPGPSEGSTMTETPPPILPTGSDPTIVPILQPLDNALENNATTSIPPTDSTPVDEEVLAQKIVNSLSFFGTKLNDMQKQLDRIEGVVTKLSGGEPAQVLPGLTLPPPLQLSTLQPPNLDTRGAVPLVDGGVPSEIILPGGLGQKRSKDATVAELVEKLKPQIQTKICEKGGGGNNGGACPEDLGLEVLEYKSQVVAGTNYFVKARTNDEKEWHLRIFHQSWTQTLELTDVQGPVEKGQELTYF